MMNQLFINLKYAVPIAIIALAPGLVTANSTEYVFSAPSEVNSEIQEIPENETDYPFHECSQEEVTEPTSETPIDSHNCDCPDCEETTEDDTELSSENQQKPNN